MNQKIKFDAADYPTIPKKRASIEIKTRLNPGIYRSSGGGITFGHYDWKLGTRNLLKAILTAKQHAKNMETGYGTHGCGSTWIEVGGVEMLQGEIDDILEPIEFPEIYHEETATQKAAEFIDDLWKGRVARDRYDWRKREDELDEERNKELSDYFDRVQKAYDTKVREIKERSDIDNYEKQKLCDSAWDTCLATVV